MKIEVEFHRCEAKIGSRVVRGLTYTELRLLATLSSAVGTVSRAELFHRVWGVIRYRAGDRRVDVMVARLRSKTGLVISCVPGEGYRL